MFSIDFHSLPLLFNYFLFNIFVYFREIWTSWLPNIIKYRLGYRKTNNNFENNAIIWKTQQKQTNFLKYFIKWFLLTQKLSWKVMKGSGQFESNQTYRVAELPGGFQVFLKYLGAGNIYFTGKWQSNWFLIPNIALLFSLFLKPDIYM